MKKLLTLSMFLLLFVCSKAQTSRVNMQYNAAGNRTHREILYTLEKIQSPIVKRDSMNTKEGTAQTALADSLAIGPKQPTSLTGKFPFEMAMYPNPAGNLLKISTNKQVDGSATLSIRDMSGKEMLRQSLNVTYSEIDLSTLNASAYTVELRYANSVQYWKIIKQ